MKAEEDEPQGPTPRGSAPADAPAAREREGQREALDPDGPCHTGLADHEADGGAAFATADAGGSVGTAAMPPRGTVSKSEGASSDDEEERLKKAPVRFCRYAAAVRPWDRDWKMRTSRRIGPQ